MTTRALLALVAATLASAPVAQAQLSGASTSTAGTTTNGCNTDGCSSFSSALQTNTASTVAARYAWNVNADGGIGTTRDRNSNAQHTVSVGATAPTTYRLTIGTRFTGDMNRSSDAINCNGQSNVSGVTGASNIALTTGSLSIADPGSLGNGTSSTSVPFNTTSTATIDRASNGVTQNHTLTFTWNGSVRSNSCEASIRLGEGGGATTSCNACSYPGSPSRTQSNDGHFVTVSLSYCGDGVTDPSTGEQCDMGGLNGGVSCCDSNCQLRANGFTCRAQAGACDIAEVCDGSNQACDVDHVQNEGSLGGTFVCRPAGGPCDVLEYCDGVGVNCPADVKVPGGTTCRASAGICDVLEACDGVNNACPVDSFEPSSTVCRAQAGVCDIAENCTGSSAACPADSKEPSSTVCRGSAGICDEVENCTGTTNDCPPDVFNGSLSGGFVCRPSVGVCDVSDECDGTGPNCPADVKEPATTVCRAVADICDVAENCDGSTDNCPADAFEPSSVTCRASAGICDPAENCTGSGAACPANSFEPSSTVCRAVAGICDIAENCTGSTAACPTDIFEPSSTVCRLAVDACDITENCTGSGAFCPSDAVVPDTDSDTLCDAIDNCPVDPNPGQENDDGDAFGNVCDACTAVPPNLADKQVLRLQGLNAPAGNEKLVAQGRVDLPNTPTMDPRTNGVRIVLEDSTATQIFDAIIPGGVYDAGTKIGWKLLNQGTNFKYINRSASPIHGITDVSVKTDPLVPGRIRFQVKGKKSNYTFPLANLPVKLTIVIDSPTAETGQCGVTNFSTPNGCKSNASGSTVRCR